jgi:hypothetical protein
MSETSPGRWSDSSSSHSSPRWCWRARKGEEGAALRISLGLRNPFSFLFVSSRREQYLAQYVLREHARGRSLEDVLADPYVRNRSTEEDRLRLLERPEVVAALGDRDVAELRRTLAHAKTAAGAGT